MNEQPSNQKSPLDIIVSAVVSYVSENKISPVELISVLSGKFKVPLKVDVGEIANKVDRVKNTLVEPNSDKATCDGTANLSEEVAKLKQELKTVYVAISKLNQRQAKIIDERWLSLDSFDTQMVAEICENPIPFTLIKTLDGDILVLSKHIPTEGWVPVFKGVKGKSRKSLS